MNRQKNNVEIIKQLLQIIKNHPELRFGQILAGFGILVENHDIFFEESEATLKRLVKSVEIINDL